HAQESARLNVPHPRHLVVGSGHQKLTRTVNADAIDGGGVHPRLDAQDGFARRLALLCVRAWRGDGQTEEQCDECEMLWQVGHVGDSFAMGTCAFVGRHYPRNQIKLGTNYDNSTLS